MDDDESIFGLGDPGSYATDNGADAGTVPDVENLVPDYPGGTISNELPSLPATNMDDLLGLGDPSDPGSLAAFVDAEENGDVSSSPASGLASTFNLSGTGLLNDLGSIGQSLSNAFLTNPQNAATAEAQALANAQISSLTSSNLFSYLLIGLVIWLVFGLFEK